MCGIVGVITKKPTASTRDMFKDLLRLDTLRGEHGTGVIAVHGNGTRTSYKKAVNGWDFSAFSPAKRILEDTLNHVLIGHNRHATVGGISDATSHPFEHGTIIGVHNGTLRTRWDLKDNATFTVDSDNLYYNMSIEGVEPTLAKLNGAFALVWHDSLDNTVHMVRNEERPLSMASSKDGSLLVFASEPWMFQIAAKRAGIELDATMNIKEGVHIIIDMDSFPSKDSVTVTDVKLKEKAPPYIAPASNFYAGRNYETNRGSSDVTSNYTNMGYFVKGSNVFMNVTGMMSTGNGDANYFITGSVGNKRVMAQVTPVTYRQISKDFKKVEKVQAKFSHMIIKLADDGKNTDITYVLNGQVDIKVVMKDIITTVSGGTVNPPLARKNKKDRRAAGKAKAKPMDTSVYEVEEDVNVVQISVEGFDGRKISVRKYAELTKCGCALCSSPVTIKDHKDLTWVSENAFLCGGCKDFDVNTMYQN